MTLKPARQVRIDDRVGSPTSAGRGRGPLNNHLPAAIVEQTYTTAAHYDRVVERRARRTWRSSVWRGRPRGRRGGAAVTGNLHHHA
jgi:hypothetical protein